MKLQRKRPAAVYADYLLSADAPRSMVTMG